MSSARFSITPFARAVPEASLDDKLVDARAIVGADGFVRGRSW